MTELHFSQGKYWIHIYRLIRTARKLDTIKLIYVRVEVTKHLDIVTGYRQVPYLRLIDISTDIYPGFSLFLEVDRNY